MSDTQLYQMAVHNGLDMDYSQWSGLAVANNAGIAGSIPATAAAGAPIAGTAPGASAAGAKVITSGGFLVIRPGVDFGLSSGMAAGLIGNFALQFQCSIFNPGADINERGATLYVLTINSGFFQTLAGSSRIIRGPLSESDILSAPLAPEQTRDALNRMVGHGFMDKMGSFLSKAKSVYAATKPVVSAIKEALPEDGKMGAVKGALGKVGYGGPAGGGRAGGAKSLSARLM